MDAGARRRIHHPSAATPPVGTLRKKYRRQLMTTTARGFPRSKSNAPCALSRRRSACSTRRRRQPQSGNVLAAGGQRTRSAASAFVNKRTDGRGLRSSNPNHSPSGSARNQFPCRFQLALRRQFHRHHRSSWNRKVIVWLLDGNPRRQILKFSNSKNLGQEAVVDSRPMGRRPQGFAIGGGTRRSYAKIAEDGGIHRLA